MTRRELREHSFKVLFRADFYPVEEMDEQIERYFGAPVEDDVTPEGTTILHDSNLSEAEQAVVTEKVKKILEKLPEIDEKINQVAEGWKTRRMGKVELTILRCSMTRRSRRRSRSMRQWNWRKSSAETSHRHLSTAYWRNW